MKLMKQRVAHVFWIWSLSQHHTYCVTVIASFITLTGRHADRAKGITDFLQTDTLNWGWWRGVNTWSRPCSVTCQSPTRHGATWFKALKQFKHRLKSALLSTQKIPHLSSNFISILLTLTSLVCKNTKKAALNNNLTGCFKHHQLKFE